MRAAKRLGSGHVALAKARIAANRRRQPQGAARCGAARTAQRPRLSSSPGSSCCAATRNSPRPRSSCWRAPKDPNRLHNLDEWWIERRLLARKMLDVGEHRTAYLIARDAALPARDIYKTEQEFTAGWIALRFLKDPAVAAQHFARIGVGSVNPTALARAGYWQGRAAEAAGRATGGPRRLSPGGRAIDQLLRPAGARQTRTAADRIERRPARPRPRVERLEIVRAVQLLYELDEREIAIPIFADMGENGDPDALVGLGELTSRYSDARGMLLMGKAALNRGLPFDHYAYPVNGIPLVQADRAGGRAEHRLRDRPAGKRRSIRPWSRRRRPTG